MNKLADYLEVNSDKIRKVLFWIFFATGLISLILIYPTHQGDDMAFPAKLTRVMLAFSVMAMVYLWLIKKNIKYFFVFCMIFFFVISNLYLMSDIVFHGYNNNWDWGDFMWMASSGGNPLYGANYPPVAVLFFAMCYTLIPTLEYKETLEFSQKYLFTFFFFFTVIALAFLFEDLFKKNKNYRLFTICIFLTSPVLFAYQRLNIIIFVLIFVMLFWRYYDSDKKWKKNAGLFSLALAANLKYYPAAYGLILLKKKRWKDSIICAVTAVVMFALPGAVEVILNKCGIYLNDATGGIIGNSFGSPAVAANTQAAEGAVSGALTSVVNANLDFLSYDSVVDNSLSIKSTVKNILTPMGVGASAVNIIGYVVLAILAAVTVWCFWVAKEQYQEFLLVSILCVMVITSSCWYYAIFLLPAFAMFMQKEKFTLFDNILFIVWIGTLGNFWGFLNFHFIQGVECTAVLWIMTVGNILYRRHKGCL